MKYLLLLFTGLSLSGCGETGRLLGEITVFPVRVLTGSSGYSEINQSAANKLLNINEAVPLHISE